MRSLLVLVISPLLLLPACNSEAPAPADVQVVAPTAPAPQFDRLSAQGRAKAKAFGGALKSELMGAIKDGGPTNAIELCNTRAMPLAAEASVEGWTVGRRSDRVRNPANSPDEWEAAQLRAFVERIAQGTAPQELEHAEIVETEQGRTFRYAKAIVLGGECLGCHGSKISPEIVAELDARYPEDQARGYAAGELRGIFSLSKRL